MVSAVIMTNRFRGAHLCPCTNPSEGATETDEMSRSFPEWASSLSRDEYAHTQSQSLLVTLLRVGMWVCGNSAKDVTHFELPRCRDAAKER